MAKQSGASFICRLAIVIATSLCFTTVALPFSQMHLPTRIKFVVHAQTPIVPAKDSSHFIVKSGLNIPSAKTSQTDALNHRLLSEYGAVQMAHNQVVPPPRKMFSSQEDVAQWQAGVETSGGNYVLQKAAAEALEAARTEARTQNLDITPRDTDAAARDYDYTVKLWMSRVDPALEHWVNKGRLSVQEAERIRALPSREQTAAILELEGQGIFFSQDFSKSILCSVAPPGASQHLALLAFDVKEHRDARVRAILARHGWYQTVARDEPHFTYLGVSRSELPSLDLIRKIVGQRVYWVPSPAAFDDSMPLVAVR